MSAPLAKSVVRGSSLSGSPPALGSVSLLLLHANTAKAIQKRKSKTSCVSWRYLNYFRKYNNLAHLLRDEVPNNLKSTINRLYKPTELFHCRKHLSRMVIKESTVQPSLRHSIATGILLGKPPEQPGYIGMTAQFSYQLTSEDTLPFCTDRIKLRIFVRIFAHLSFSCE